MTCPDLDLLEAAVESLRALSKNPHVGRDESVAELRETVQKQLMAAVAQGTQDERERARPLLASLRAQASSRLRLLKAL